MATFEFPMIEQGGMGPEREECQVTLRKPDLPLNNFKIQGNFDRSQKHQKRSRMFKKARSPARSRFGGARSSKAAGPLVRGAYRGVREDDKGTRTPLADFFNILPGYLPISLSGSSVTIMAPRGFEARVFACRSWSISGDVVQSGVNTKPQ